MNVTKSIKSSISGWEDSWFGGYKKVLWDHPEIKTDPKLEFETQDDGGLGWYRWNKLVKLFLLISKEAGISSMYSQNLRSERLEKLKVTRHHLTPEVLSKGLGMLSEGYELSNMFNHYSKVILETDIYYDEPDQKEEGEDSLEEGSGKSPKDQMGKCLTSVRKKKVIKYSGMRWSSSHDSNREVEPVFKTIQQKSPVQYTSQEMLYASQLVNMLDISFEPAIDKVQSLKAGKLDVNKICEVSSGNFNVYYRKEEVINTKPFSVCVLCDESGSMGNMNKIGYARDMMKILYLAFSSIIPADRLYFYGHTSTGTDEDVEHDEDDEDNNSWGDTAEIRVYHDKYNHTFNNTISYCGTDMRDNYDGPVMNAIYDKIRSYTDDNIIFIVLSDGEPCGEGYGGASAIVDIKRVIEKCKRDGFVTIGIGMLFDQVKNIYPYHTVIKDMGEMVKKTSLIINHVVKTEFQ